MSFDVIAGSCVPHVAGIEPELERVIPAGTEQEIRVFDAAGSLCHDPNGALSCSWRATSTVETDSGTAAGSLDFRTSAPVPRVEPGCERTPVIVSPHDGDVVSGVVPIQFTVVESSRCIITARTIVRVYSERGDLVAESVPYDVGEVFRWDTRRVENGRYRIRAAQNCCQIDGVAARVTVRN